MAARSSLLRRPTPGARPARRTSSVVAALAALAPRLVRLARHHYPDRLLAQAVLLHLLLERDPRDAERLSRPGHVAVVLAEDLHDELHLERGPRVAEVGGRGGRPLLARRTGCRRSVFERPELQRDVREPDHLA